MTFRPKNSTGPAGAASAAALSQRAPRQAEWQGAQDLGAGPPGERPGARTHGITFTRARRWSLDHHSGDLLALALSTWRPDRAKPSSPADREISGARPDPPAAPLTGHCFVRNVNRYAVSGTNFAGLADEAWDTLGAAPEASGVELTG